MRFLVVGSGGREHALVGALLRSPSAPEVIAAPGNPGIAARARCVALDAQDPAAVAALADELDVDVVVVGPEGPLVAGAADAVRAKGRLAFGPGAEGARLEGSKAWMKHVLVEAGVPTARHATFSVGDEAGAFAFLESLDGLYVVKTDGLAAGKGVVVTESLRDARDAVTDYLSGSAFGDAGRTLVIEEGLTGPEVSLLVVCNGDPDGAHPLAPAQDFKRLGDDDSGPNTGGMGAYSPVAGTEAIVDQVMDGSVRPTLAWLRDRGVDYRGVLYAGLMLTPAGPKMLEYNVRFGDPECQVVTPRFASDFAELVRAAAAGLPIPTPRFSTDACVTVVLAAEGYPASPRSGAPITGIEAAEALDGVQVFHAGTAREGEGLVTAGGRVLDVTAVGATVADARARAYEAAARISWPGMQCRTDIAARPGVTP